MGRCLGLVQLVRKDVGQDGVVAAAVHVLQGLDGGVIFSRKNLDNAQVLLSLGGAGLAEAGFGGLEVILSEGHHALGVDNIGILGVKLAEAGLGLGHLALAQVKDGQVVHGTLGIETLDGLLVDALLLGGILGYGSHAEEGLLVQNLLVVLQDIHQFLVGVVLHLHVGNEAGAAEFRQHLSLEGGEHLGHVADFVLTDGRVRVHGQDTEDEFLVFDGALGNQLLEAFPVFTHAADGGVQALVALHHLVPGLGGTLGTVGGELVVHFLRAFRRGVSHNFGALDSGALVGGGGIQGGQEFLHGLALELGVADLGAVYVILDLTFGGGDNHVLVIVFLEGQVAGTLHQHVSGVGAIGHFLDGQVDGLLSGQHLAAEFQMALFHAFHIVEVEALRHLLAFGGNHLVVVLHLLSLVLDGLHGSLSSVIDNDRSDFQHHVGVEVILGIRYRNHGVYASANHFQYGRLAAYLDVLGHFGHLLRGCAGRGEGGGCEND